MESRLLQYGHDHGAILGQIILVYLLVLLLLQKMRSDRSHISQGIVRTRLLWTCWMAFAMYPLPSSSTSAWDSTSCVSTMGIVVISYDLLR